MANQCLLTVPLSAVLAGCTHTSVLIQLPDVGAEYFELSSTPYYEQQDYFCGPSSLAAVLEASGAGTVDFKELIEQVYLPGKHGTLQVEMLAATRRYQRISYVIRPQLRSLIEELEAGHPVVVLQNLTPLSTPRWHYAVVIGFDRNKNQIILRSGSNYRLAVSTYRFTREWERAGNWGFIALPPGELPADNDASRYLQAVSAFQNVGDPKATELGYATAVRRWPDQEVGWIGLAEAQYKNGDIPAAIETLRKLSAIQPHSVAAYNNLALLLNETGCVDQAQSMLRKALSMARERGRFILQVEDTRKRIETKVSQFKGNPCTIN